MDAQYLLLESLFHTDPESIFVSPKMIDDTYIYLHNTSSLASGFMYIHLVYCFFALDCPSIWCNRKRDIFTFYSNVQTIEKLH